MRWHVVLIYLLSGQNSVTSNLCICSVAALWNHDEGVVMLPSLLSLISSHF